MPHLDYLNGTSLHKQKCRDFIFQEVRVKFRRQRVLSICTLSNTTYILEKRLLEHYNGSTLFLVEHKYYIFKQIACHWAGLDARVLYGDVFDVLMSGIQHNVIWVDSCSSLTVSIIRDFRLILLTQKDALFACTIIGCREQKNTLKEYKASSFTELRERFPSIISKGTDYKLILYYHYLSDSKLPMILYIFKRLH